MKIVFITPSFKLGGYEKVVVNYANSFSILGHNITIICGFRSGELMSQLNKNINVVCLNSRIRNFLIPLKKFMDNNTFDILYAPFSTYTSVAVVARFLSKNKKFLIYGSSHGYDEGNVILNYIARFFLMKADILTGVTQDLCNFDAKKYKLPISKYKVFNNPVITNDTEIGVIYHKWLDKKKCPVVCMSGRLDKNKNYELAFKILAQINKIKMLKMIVLGDGEHGVILKSYLKEHSMENIVDFIGFVDNPLNYISQCDVFLHTAKLESFGNVIVEALYCNIPVVSTNCKGPEEILSYGKYGVLIGCADDKNVVDRGVRAILDIVDGKIKFEGLKQRALDFDARNLEKDFVNYYHQIMEERDLYNE